MTELDQALSSLETSLGYWRSKQTSLQVEFNDLQQRLHSVAAQAAHAENLLHELSDQIQQALASSSQIPTVVQDLSNLTQRISAVDEQLRELSKQVTEPLRIAQSDLLQVVDKQKSLEDSLERKLEHLEVYLHDVIRRIQVVEEPIHRLGTDFVMRSNHLVRLGEIADKESEPAEKRNTKYQDFYALWEDRYRGTEALITERQSQYVPFFADEEPVLDVACGRGEFLDLLTANGIKGRGVDINPFFIHRCKSKHLDVAEEDAFHYLAGLPPSSLGGIFSAQFIEHLKFENMVELVQLCTERLRPGGLIVLETINPHCQTALNLFYLDPTHVRPYFPEVMEVLLDWLGYEEIEVRYSTSAVGANSEREPVAPLDFGDYAIIGRKKRG